VLVQRTIQFLVGVLVIVGLLSVTVFCQQAFDPKTIKVTRWVDSTTHPTSYIDFNRSRNFSPSASIKKLQASLNANLAEIDIVVNQDLYPLIESSLDTFFTDLALDGYNVTLYTALETQSATALRDLLRQDWQTRGIRGAILIGDLAVPWYEMDEPAEWGGAHVEFPCDLFYMDLDGSWGDSNSNGLYDSHDGALLADIWIGRLTASPMQLNGATEVTVLQNYFSKNHRYRTGEFRLNDHALSFIDDDWCTTGWSADVASAYPSTDSIVLPESTIRLNYITRLRETSNNRYDHVLLCSHSSAFSHSIRNNSTYEQFHNYHIESFMMQAISYNLFACSNARYIETDNMGGWYIYETNYGLLSIGSTKTGSMLEFRDFYYPLAWGYNFGEAFLYWAQLNIETYAGEQSRAWFYGMCIQGDPTIKIARYQYIGQPCLYLPGDINGNGSVIGADVTFGVRYLKGLGSIPPDSCVNDSVPTINHWLYVAADVNGDCRFMGSDITRLVQYLKGVSTIQNCRFFPPPPILRERR
jgi:hypothetical protein